MAAIAEGIGVGTLKARRFALVAFTICHALASKLAFMVCQLWYTSKLSSVFDRHSPEETYLVLSEGSFGQRNDPKFARDIGGTFYNSPDNVYAMRSEDTPLFAFWLLWTGRPAR